MVVAFEYPTLVSSLHSAGEDAADSNTAEKEKTEEKTEEKSTEKDSSEVIEHIPPRFFVTKKATE